MKWTAIAQLNYSMFASTFLAVNSLDSTARGTAQCHLANVIVTRW
jgi:hypothetical protein